MIRFEDEDIVIHSEAPPAWLRLIFAIVALPLVGVGVVSAFNMASRVWRSPPQPDPTWNEVAFGVVITAGFLGVGTLLLLLGALSPERILRFEPRQRRAHLTSRHAFVTIERRFAFEALEPPRPVFTAADSESSAKWSLVLRLPRRTTIDYCASDLPLAEQKAFAEIWSARISRLLAEGRRPDIAEIG